MSSPISSVGKNLTKQTFLDRSRPLVMHYADDLFDSLVLKRGDDPVDVLELMTDIQKVFEVTKSYEPETFWTNFEKIVNKGRTVPTKAKNDSAKIMQVLSLFYGATNYFDADQSSTEPLAILRPIFTETYDTFLGKFASEMSSQNKNLATRVGDTIDERMVAVASSLNTLQEQGLIPGLPIPV